MAHYFVTPSGRAQITRLDREGVKSGLNFDDVKGLSDGLVPRDAIRLIRYQILGESFEFIAANPGNDFDEDANEDYHEELSISGATKGVKRFAALVGITLRVESRVGRKQGRSSRT